MARSKAVFDAQAYMAWEAEQSNKHKYHDGEVCAMAGASEAHVTVAPNVPWPCASTCGQPQQLVHL
jgi:hypothetical protein